MDDRLLPMEPDDDPQAYAAVPSELLRPWISGRFSVYVKKSGHFVLYAGKGGAYTRDHRHRLRQLGVDTVFILRAEISGYERYLRESLSEILRDESIPMERRAEAWYSASASVAKDVLSEKLPKPLSKMRYNQIERMVRESVGFFKTPDALKNLVRLMSKGYQDYHHGVSVMVLTAFTIQESGVEDDELLVKCGIGAILHDLGKVGVPRSILDKNRDSLSAEEHEIYRSHPSLGVGLCVSLPLPIETFHCILFHHEQEDGKGFPSRLPPEAIPMYVKALSVCNVYDRLTRATAYRPAYTPYEALRKIETRKEAFNVNMIKRLIRVLSNAEALPRDAAKSSAKGPPRRKKKTPEIR